MTESQTRAGFAAIIGAPNAGKSTLVNRMTGTKVSIVTKKVQTTRFPVRGVVVRGEIQIVLVDTPGVFRPRRRLDRAMVASAWSGAEDADAVVHLVDAAAEMAVAAGKGSAADKYAVEDARTVTERLKEAGGQPILALNKIDGLPREALLPLVQRFSDTGVYSDVFLISAEKGSGVDDLLNALVGRMPLGPWLYPEDQAADVPLRVLAAEITREKLYLRLHEELPYAAAVQTTSFDERADGSVRIEQEILVEREGQRPIVLGKGGQTVKWIGQKAREELELLMDRKVHLFLTVKADPRWMERRELFGQMGLDFDA
ncbi:GTPase Era [Brevundimonas sp. 2R-24]|uniref:GTPase Era n=1 Tax=Peiella sedimenti TaxID=3061083 RepID=A0ABT8SPT2_9CAUL|nr:GTPase Era [Caulobacteraceae bacterium XZ-24]